MFYTIKYTTLLLIQIKKLNNKHLQNTKYVFKDSS